MAKGLGYKKFLENFSDDLQRNDKIAEKLVKFEEADYNFHGDGSCYILCLQSSSAMMSLIWCWEITRIKFQQGFKVSARILGKMSYDIHKP